MLYIEFLQYQKIEDPDYPLCQKFMTKSGHTFYIEPGFYYALQGFKEKRRDDFQKIMDAIDAVVKENEKVIFTGNYETPMMEKDGYIYRDIYDITDPLQIFVEDKSRGSDYGD
jgi:hypothetical protein